MPRKSSDKELHEKPTHPAKKFESSYDSDNEEQKKSESEYSYPRPKSRGVRRAKESDSLKSDQ